MANTVLLILLGEYCLIHFLMINISLNFDNINCTGEFKKLMDENVFVDKSEFIKEFLEYEEKKAIEITRPDGFGKSVNLDMLKTFLEIEVDEYGNIKQEKNNEKYFKNLKISKYKNIIEEYQGKYPVVYITFTNQNKMEQIQQSIREAFLQHRYLLQVKTLKESDKKILQKYFDNKWLSEIDLSHSIFHLRTYLLKHFNKTPVLLVDNFDGPILEWYPAALLPVPGKGIIMYHFNILSVIIRANNVRILMCGTLPIFDDINLYTIYNYFSAPDSKFSSSFGFTENEVAVLLRKFRKDNEREIIKQHYGGYYFSEHKNIVYCSRSVLTYLKNGFYEIDEDISLSNYYQMVRSTYHLILQDYLNLMKNVTLNKEVSNEPIYCFKNHEINYVTESTIFPFGVHFGYINLDETRLKIPNMLAQKNLAYSLGIFFGRVASKYFLDFTVTGNIMFECLKRKNYNELIDEVDFFFTKLYETILSDNMDSVIPKVSWLEGCMYTAIVSSKYRKNFQVFAKENVEIMNELDIAADHILVPFYGKGSEVYIIKYKIFKSPKNGVRNHSSTEYEILTRKYPYIKTICHVTISLQEYKNLRITNETINL